LASSATQIAIAFDATWFGTAGVNDYFEVTGVQIDIGSVALPFRTYAATLKGELAASQRYYFSTTSTSSYGVSWSTRISKEYRASYPYSAPKNLDKGRLASINLMPTFDSLRPPSSLISVRFPSESSPFLFYFLDLPFI
jgi:hypothetical protein